MRFQNKVVWITGASSGIGEALAYAFHQEGAKLILSSRREEALEQVRQNCGGNQEDIVVLPLDLADLESLPEKAKRALEAFGHIDILVHNGGMTQRALAIETRFEIDQLFMNTHYFGTVILTKAVLSSMIERKSGHFVVVSSLMGLFGTPLRSAYCAAKHAQHGFFDALRAEVWRDNIYVTLVCPGFVRTNIAYNALTGDGTQVGKVRPVTPHGISPESCAAQILKAVWKKKEEIYPGGPEKYSIYIKRFFPGLLSRIVRRMKVT